VVDFNPVVHRGLRERGIKVAYGDISQPETLIHAGVRNAEVLICTVPDFLLKGVTNERLVRQLRSLNPTATILAPAELIADVDALYEAGADYVMVTRLFEATHLCEVLEAIEEGLLASKRDLLANSLEGRREVLA
jgi:voltage-gated potassium channel Kch